MIPLLLALIPHLLVAAALLLATGLFFSLKVEIQVLARRRLADRRHSLQMAAEWTALFQRLQSELEHVSRLAGEMQPPTLPAPRPGLNLNRRSQVLRLAKRGERPEQIAAALGVPQNEVDLLLKLNQPTIAA